MLAIVAPGQGSQTPGFLDPWLEVDGVRARLEELGEAAELDLVAHGTTSDADTIRDTAVAQPLIVGAALAALEPLLASTGTTPVSVTAGHSVGEFAAAALAGVVTGPEAMTLVRERSRGMAEAAAAVPTGMSAVLGGDPEEVVTALHGHGLTPANMNGAGQIVAAGTLEQLAALAAEPPARTRVIPLKVAGAFHTHHMAPAVDRLARTAATVTPQDPTLTLLSNADGGPVADGATALARLVDQVSNPVRWDLTMESLATMGVTALIELPPAGTLVGLAKRGLRGVETLALKSPEDLDRAASLTAEHGAEDRA